MAKVAHSVADFFALSVHGEKCPGECPRLFAPPPPPHHPSPLSATMVPDCCKKKSVGFLRTRKYLILFIRNSEWFGSACMYTVQYYSVQRVQHCAADAYFHWIRIRRGLCKRANPFLNTASTNMTWNVLLSDSSWHYIHETLIPRKALQVRWENRDSATSFFAEELTRIPGLSAPRTVPSWCDESSGMSSPGLSQGKQVGKIPPPPPSAPLRL